MNFKNKYLVILAIIFTLATSCEDLRFGDDFLEKPTGGEMNIDSVFTRKIYAEQLLAQVYHTLPDFLPQDNRLSWSVVEVLTDLADITKSGSSVYHSGQISSAMTTSSVYSMSYNTKDGEASAVYAFRLGNIFLENVDRVPDMTDEEKSIRKGEAKLIMAMHYVQVFRNLGGMPWIDRSYRPDDELKFTRMTIDEAVTNTCRLIDEAVALLPWSVEASDDGRMTAAAGMALKSRLLLFAASPLFNNENPYKAGEAADKQYVWYGDYSEDRWKEAFDASLAFIDANNSNGEFYRLVDTGNPRADYLSGYFNRYNKEVLMAGHRWTTVDRWSNAINQFRWGTAHPTMNHVDMFQMKDGSQFDWDNPEHRAHPFFKYKLDDDNKPVLVNGRRVLIEVRDSRLYETVVVNEDLIWNGIPADIYLKGLHGPQFGGGAAGGGGWNAKGYSGVAVRKLILDGREQVSGKFYQCPLLRLPEVYLNIAEAMNELGMATQRVGPDNLDAYDYVNLVRARVDMPGLDRSKISEGEELREAILYERAIEFGYEEVRYYDMVRWKRKDWLEVPLRRLITTKESDGTFTYEIKEGMTHRRSWAESWDDRYYLTPIPLDEINKKYGLVQNPGWE